MFYASVELITDWTYVDMLHILLPDEVSHYVAAGWCVDIKSPLNNSDTECFMENGGFSIFATMKLSFPKFLSPFTITPYQLSSGLREKDPPPLKYGSNSHFSAFSTFSLENKFS